MSMWSAIKREAIRHSRFWTLTVIFVLALLLTFARVLLPQVENYRPQIEAMLSEQLHEKVTIADFEVTWHGLGPRLLLKDVHILDRNSLQPLLGFAEARIDINMLSSLRSLQPDFGSLTVVGADITVVRKENGDFEVVGVKLREDNQPLDVDEVLRWMWRQGVLAAESSRLRFLDRQHGDRSWTFTNINLLLKNDEKKSRLTGRLNLPSQIGQGLALALDFERTGDAPRDWKVNYYFKSNELALDSIAHELKSPKFAVHHGAADVELWGEWRSALTDLRGRVNVRGLEFSVADTNAAAEVAPAVDQIPRAEGEFVWKRNQAGWGLELDRLRVIHAGREWPEIRAHVALTNATADNPVMEVAANYVPINDVVTWVLMSPNLNHDAKEALTTIAPSGALRDMMLRWQKRDEKPLLYLRAALDNVSTSPWHQIPGVSGVNAVVNTDLDSGVFDLAAANLEVRTDNLFREPLPLRSVKGRVAWVKLDDGWHVDLRQVDVNNEDIEAELTGKIFVPVTDSSPVVDLAAAFQNGSTTHAGRYFPVGIMSPSLVGWLDRALVKGVVPAGTFRMKGPLRQFPYADGSGTFEVRFAAKDATLDYSEGWPRIEDIAADVAFIGDGLEVHGKRGKIFDAEVHDVDVRIRDFKSEPLMLEINGQAEASAVSALRYLQESPLREMILGKAFDRAAMTGSARLVLDLKLPLTGEDKVAVVGDVTLADAGMTLPDYSLDIDHVTGGLRFTETGIETKRLDGMVLGQPARVAISTQATKKSRYFVFRGQGDARYGELARRFPSIPVFGFVEGGSPWQAELKLDASGDHPESSLKVSSNLVGTAVKLPAPLTKPSKTRVPLTVRGRFSENNSTWQIDYGEMLLSALFSLESSPAGELRLKRGDVRIGERALLAPGEGVRISGEFASISDKEWRPVVDSFVEVASKAAAGTAPTVEVNRVMLKAGVATIGDVQFDNVTVNADKIQGVWIANIDSKQLSGKVNVPQKPGQTLEMDLQRLQIPKDLLAGKPSSASSANEADTSLADKADPRKLPPLRINSEHFIYGEYDLGKLALVTEPSTNGLMIDTLELNNPHATMKATGSWNRIGKAHTSTINADLTIRDLGSTLGGLGYNTAVRNGEGKGVVSLRWPGPIFAPMVKRLEGTVRFDINDGALLEVEPGAGRLFGLLSIQALPRRLTLDFRDFFSKGFSFDYMRGGFEIEDGNATIQDFALDGPAAKVTMTGRVGLADRDYDQQVVVTPHLTSGLPVVGAVAGGLGVGAAVLLAEKLLKPKISEVSEIKYSITGSWDAPVVKRISGPPPPAAEPIPELRPN